MKKAQTTAALIAMFASYAALILIIMLLYWYIGKVNTPDAQQDLTSAGAQHILTNHQLLRNILRTPITINGETLEFSDALIKNIEANTGAWGDYGSNELNAALRATAGPYFTDIELDIFRPEKDRRFTEYFLGKPIFRVDKAQIPNKDTQRVAATILPTPPGSTHPYYIIILSIIPLDEKRSQQS